MTDFIVRAVVVIVVGHLLAWAVDYRIEKAIKRHDSEKKGMVD